MTGNLAWFPSEHWPDSMALCLNIGSYIISGWPQDRPKKSALAFPSHSIALNITVASHGTLKIIISTHGIRKFHFPMSFAMTMLSWSVLEYEDKYKSINEYDHTRELLKWGTDYLLRTFNSSAYIINHIYGQVGGSRNGSVTPDDHNCWERPEDMDYERSTQRITSGLTLLEKWQPH
ncbi:endoglucanase 12-like protein [Tanacetum coccineum]